MAGDGNDPAVIAARYTEVQSWFLPESLGGILGLGASEVERISLEWLGKAGKRWRPFLAACMFDAFAAEGGNGPDPAAVRQIVIALECIHKASLVYDDVQDGDDQRYGEPTVHVLHGVPVALTVSLHLLGLGYRLIADCAAPPDRRAAMLTLATDGHCQLCLGQGAELLWMRSPRPLTPGEVLDIFRLKTAPSFDVVFRLPALAHGAGSEVHAVLRAYAEAIGTAYQVADDLDDFHGGGDVDDVMRGRPSIVMALVHQAASGTDRDLIAETWCARRGDPARVKQLIADLGSEQAARDILAGLKRDALGSLDRLTNRRLAGLLARVADMVFA